MRITNLEKWKKLLEKNYGFENPTQKEVFEFANTLTNFFDLLLKFQKQDELKNENLCQQKKK